MLNDMNVNLDGHLIFGGCNTVYLAQKYGTPLYLMSEKVIRDNCRAYKNAMEKYFPDGKVIYASKAFMNKAMCRIAYSEGLHIDVVSGGELYTALQAGIPGEFIEFHGNNKTPEELEMAIENDVSCIVVDNFEEITLIRDIAMTHELTGIPVAIRLRPGIEAHTHEAVQTANLDCKFGFSIANGDAKLAMRLLGTDCTFYVKGAHCHIGSQIFESEPFKVLAEQFVSFAAMVKRDSGVCFRNLNFGGGFGIWYANGDEPLEPECYIKTIHDELKRLCEEYDFPMPTVSIEPGRGIVGEAGITLYTVGSVKEIPDIRKYVCVDGGMYENPRCALYGAKYTAFCASKMFLRHNTEMAIAGKCCESGDMITWSTLLPRSVQKYDILAVLTTGAYNYSMAGNYNRNGIPAVVLVNDGLDHVIVRRQTYQDIAQYDEIPAHLR